MNRPTNDFAHDILTEEVTNDYPELSAWIQSELMERDTEIQSLKDKVANLQKRVDELAIRSLNWTMDNALPANRNRPTQIRNKSID